MDAGALRYRLRLQSKTVTRDAVGGELETWSDEATVWGSAEPLTGRELLLAQQPRGEIMIRFRIRYRANITELWRVVWENKTYQIMGPPIDVGGLHQQLLLQCAFGLRYGVITPSGPAPSGTIWDNDTTTWDIGATVWD